MSQIPPYPTWAPGPNLLTVTPNDTTDIPGIPSSGCKIHNIGTSGLVSVDGALSGTAIPLYLRQGDWSPCLVKRVRATDLGAGVALVATW